MSNEQMHDLLADAREVYGIFGKGQRALTIVNRALEIEPENVEALNLKAAILYDLDQDEEARELHLHVITRDPNSVEALHGLTALANDTGAYEEALQWAERGFTAIPHDPYQEFIENEDYRQRLIAELYNEKAFALWYLGKRDEAKHLLITVASEQCPLEVEAFEDQLDWLQHHPNSPDE